MCMYVWPNENFKFSKSWPRLWTKSKILNKIGHLYIDMGSTIIIKTCYIWIALPLWRTYNTRKLVFKKVCLRTVHRQMHCHHLLIGHGCPAGLMYTIFAGLIRVMHSVLWWFSHINMPFYHFVLSFLYLKIVKAKICIVSDLPYWSFINRFNVFESVCVCTQRI